MAARTSASQRATREAVRSALEGKRTEPGAVIFRLLLITMLLSLLLILIVLLGDILIGAWPTLRDRGLDFVFSGLSLNPETAGVWTGIIGSLPGIQSERRAVHIVRKALSRAPERTSPRRWHCSYLTSSSAPRLGGRATA